MLDPADLPPDDILDYVAIDTDNTGQLRVRVVKGKKHLRAVREYLTRLRLTRAKELLRATDLPVSEVAYRVGMENTSYFISVFRSREGATPQQYRRRWSPVA